MLQKPILVLPCCFRTEPVRKLRTEIEQLSLLALVQI
ncbi:hypothetical protein AWRI1631_103390 [Saccharomyces cerevisiae AWRI1631]|uniref:Uncharacterized protein n=1 Tax=Saccharomyces cerevisiae (strain AWRI1631) TaxID=545124 RepID=B5VLU2_YEAS6|nr:hypothetical protein AWRI1631_103390 [Saccharomyces cerevisiae AWRI1631]